MAHMGKEFKKKRVDIFICGLPWWLSGKESTCSARVLSRGQEGPLEEEMAIHSNILAWKIPWTEEPGGL